MSDPTTDHAAHYEPVTEEGQRILATVRELHERVASLTAERDEARKALDDRVCESCDDLEENAKRFYERSVRAETALRDVKLWFDTRPWEGTPDGSSHGGGTRGYSDNERKLGYGTYRDPRHLPAALAVSSASEAETDHGPHVLPEGAIDLSRPAPGLPSTQKECVCGEINMRHCPVHGGSGV